MAKKKVEFFDDIAFYERLWEFYNTNRSKIRSRYNDLTKKFLSYNDASINPNAFLRLPQFEALEIYVFIKEFMNNPQVYELFDDWRKRQGKFADGSYYAIRKNGESFLFDDDTEQYTNALFERMKEYNSSYPNYIYALTMGLGKTILMATCIFYEFLLANKYPKDKRFCQNALVFAPDKTVLESLKEIQSFDKSKVVPPEYAHLLDTNLKFHILDGDGVMLKTLDDSKFNIIISNTQKIIVKEKKAELKISEKLFSNPELSRFFEDVDDDDDAWDNSTLIENQRYKKLCRLPQLGVYVDEAHHLFGADLKKDFTSLRKTIDLLAKETSIVACYSYTGTPYVDKQVLPEVVYAYGLENAILKGYLKDADSSAFENVKNEEFLKKSIEIFWDRYGGKRYEGLNPKLAIYATNVDEAVKVVRPQVEKIIAKLGLSAHSILVNVGDDKYTKNEDIKNFNDLDRVGTQGDEKQFIILVGKGKEGWNCRSLFGVAMFRNPSKSRVFVLQATMRCLRKITQDRQRASIFLSQENYEVLNDELNKNFNISIENLKNSTPVEKKLRQVRYQPPKRTIKVKYVERTYELREKEYTAPICFGIDEIDFSKYESKMYQKTGIVSNNNSKEINIDEVKEQNIYSAYTLSAKLACYLNICPLLCDKILKECVDGAQNVVDAVNKHNEVFYDVLVSIIFNTLYETETIEKTYEKELVLLNPPSNASYYEFSASDEMTIEKTSPLLKPSEVAKSFHADTYCFDSRPEKECFLQYIRSNKVKEIYFTGMFTAEQGDFHIQYYDPESCRMRNYYPDFIAKLDNDTYQIIEVKGDDKLEDELVKAKQEAAEQMATASDMEYIMIPSSKIMKGMII